jgi:hypothetical protein
MEMAAGAGLHTVATDLHVPEQGFTKLYGSLTVLDDIVEIRRQGDTAVLSYSPA